MVVQHNIPALNSHRYLGVNNNAAAKNLEKLSSGYKINRAGDDAAGLAISEKMRGQIRGLAKAEDNTNNAINLIQTAEGGMQEMHSIVQRMRELAVQSTNGTYHNSVDREALDQEFQQLKEEFNRIVDYTNYNNIKLLNGDPWGTGAGAQPGYDVIADTTSRVSVPAAGDVTGGGAGEFGTGGGGDVDITLSLDADGNIVASVVDNVGAPGVNYDASYDADTGVLTLSDGTAANDVTIKLSKTEMDNMKKEDGGLAEVVIELRETAGAPTIAATGITTSSYKDATEFMLATSPDSTAKLGLADLTGLVAGTTGEHFDAALTVTLTFAYDFDTDKVVGTATGAGGTYTLTETSTPGVWEIEETGANEKYTFNFDATKLGGAEGDIGQFTIGLDFTSGAAPTLTAGSAATFEVVSNPNFVPNAGGGGGVAPGQRPTNITDRNNQTILFQVGANGTADQQVSLTLYDMSAKWLGWGTNLTGCSNLPATYDLYLTRDNDGKVNTTGGTAGTDFLQIRFADQTTYANLSVQDLHIADKDASNIAIEVLYTALNDVSTKRAELGAVQNRLEYTLNNLGVTKENLTAAESTIRDVDMAKEMMDFTKNSILIQSAQAMLAQANTLPQGVLQLLR